MCGIAGFIDTARQYGPDELRFLVTGMEMAIAHRGPDDHNCWVDAGSGVALGHRRLSIIDLSVEGRQPMMSENGDLIIVFNGEIYNFQELRSELEALGCRFRGHSDTEVMLAAFSHWGLDASARRFNGMYAFAVWDRQQRILQLCRDRLGKKPLYYGWAGNTFLFASELKALRAHPAFAAEVDRNALALYFRFGYIPAPYTIYEGIYKLPPSTHLTVNADVRGSRGMPVPYWSARAAAEAGLQNRIGNVEDALAELDGLLRSAVGLRMVADVPLGAFLSGGIDSSLIVALMQALSSRPVKTFCIGFQEQTHNEAEHARAVARHLGTEHTELILTASQALDIVPRLPQMFDEPFSDSSGIPTFLVSELARQHVTVSLSGDGGDELFAGYTTYQSCSVFYKKYGWMPDGMRAAAGRVLQTVPQSVWNGMLPNGGPKTAGARLHRLASTFKQITPEAAYMSMISGWENPGSLVPGSQPLPTPFATRESSNLSNFTEKMMLLDSLVYLPDDILVKVDRASMAVSLEARAPLLDYRVFELAWRVPLEFKVREGKTKWILRELLYRYVPKEIVDRPKSGFAVPLATWLRGPLRPWAEDLLDAGRLRRESFLAPDKVRQTWREHLEGRDWSKRLWTVLMLESWLASAGTAPPLAAVS